MKMPVLDVFFDCLPDSVDLDADQLSQQIARYLQYFHRHADLLCYVYDVCAYLFRDSVQGVAGNVDYGQGMRNFQRLFGPIELQRSISIVSASDMP